MNYPYDHNYKLHLSIGFWIEERDTINPAYESSYSQEEWEALPDKQKQDWLESQLREWLANWVKASVSP